MIDKAPDKLRSTGRFCLWKREERGGRPTKVPYTVTGARASVSRPEDFVSYEDARAALERRPDRFSGLGLGLFDDFVGIDIDHCIGPDGQLTPLAVEVIDRIGSYAERSPSNTGVHILCRAPGLVYGPEYLAKNSDIGLEIYVAGQTSRYLTFTGERLNDLDVAADCGAAVLELAEKYMRRAGKTDTPTARVVDFTDYEDETTAALNDAEVLARVRAASNAEKFERLYRGEWSGDYGSQSEADLALANILVFYTQANAAQCERLFRKSGLMREKFDRTGNYYGQETYGRGLIAKAIRECKEVWSPDYRSSSVEITPDVERALAFLRDADAAHNPRYTRDDIGGGYLLADYLKPTARPLTGSRGVWMRYDGTRWLDDTDGIAAENGAKAMSKALITYSLELPENERNAWMKWAARWATRNQRSVFINDARSVYPVTRAEFDTDPMLLNCLNGTLDLSTMELHPHDPDDRLTQIAGAEYDEAAAAPLWENTLAAVLPDADTRDFFRRWSGYCMTGSTSEEALVILYGRTSRNGKSTLAEAIAGTLGDYAAAAPPAVIAETARHDSRGPSEDVARLRGKRLVTISEPSQTMVFDAALLKTMTGGDTLTCRFLHENSFEYCPAFKFVVNTNYLPRVNDLTLFRSGRIMVIPFGQRFVGANQDKTLKAKLAAPLMRSVILNWLVSGLKEYQRDGLQVSAEMHDALKDYEANSDKVGRFIAERLKPAPGHRATISMVYDQYTTWCFENGCHAESAIRFKEVLRDHGLEVEKARPSTGGGATTVLFDYAVVFGEPVPVDDIHKAESA